MPNDITLHAVEVWFVWGLVMSLGWTLGSWLLGRILSRMP